MSRADDPGDAWLFGWDPTPGIVSVYASGDGRALVWRRVAGGVRAERAAFRPWVFASTLDDLAHLTLPWTSAGDPAAAPVLVRTLAGAPDGYCYLISARPGVYLERLLRAAAAHRRGIAHVGLEETGCYYRVGAVEQYLMQTGRTCFRGMVYADLRRVQLDFETTALDPAAGRIFMAALRDTHGDPVVLEAPNAADEPQLLRDLCALIRSRDPDVIENHNLFGFDLPWLVARAAAHGVRLVLGRAPGPPLLDQYTEGGDRRRTRFTLAGRELIDTLEAVRRHDFVTRDLPGHGLKDVARAFGLAAPDRVYLPGAAIRATYETDPALVRRYALDDVAEVAALSQRLLGAPFALAGMAPRRYERVASAGPAMGILEPMLVRAYLQAGHALPRVDDDAALAPHTGGATVLYAAGVARNVVKADIASLYPSLMRADRIGPACDTLGVLLALNDQLTTLRLAHKAAAKQAAPGSLEHGHHDALQAAMKLIINAGYGYMGAGHMALFADRHAADTVTRRGREVLAQVTDGLRRRGVTLLEADTDGVYFAVPADWDEATERALVAAVAAELPAGLRLEYEARYAAMLSHEVKNYALLGYDGRLILRGAAMRSSRSEPYGTRFLERALRCLLAFDVAGVRAAFDETVAALRTRALPAADLASRTRLSKTPDEYRQSKNREAAYEALLAAGRTTWRAGERIRCFRGADGNPVWLPDRSDDRDAAPATDDRRDYDIAYYVNLLIGSSCARLASAFTAADFAQLFRADQQIGLFDVQTDEIGIQLITLTP